MKKLGTKLGFLVVFTSSLLANIDVKSIDMFNNKTFLNQNLDLSKKSVELLDNVRLEDLRFNLKDGCEVKSTDIKYSNGKNDELSKQIEELNRKINSKENEIKSLKSNISFLEKTSISSISTPNSLETTSTFLKKEILSNYNLIYEIERYIKEDKEELNELIKKRANNRLIKLDYDISCSNTKSISVSYPVRNIFRNSFYEINFNSNNNKLDIKNSSFITQSTGMDFKNIDINLYTYNFVYQLKPNKFIPEYLDTRNVLESLVYSKAAVVMDAMPMKKSLRANSISKPSYVYIEDTTKSFFKASNINLQSGKKTEVTFANDNYKANKSTEIDGYSSSQAFYRVNFKSKKLYGVLNAKLYLDDTYIGRNTLKEIKKDKKTDIYFGTNRFIDVKKELIKDMKEKPFFSINKLKTQKIWKYTVTNSSSKVQNITLLDRAPVSKDKEIKVKLIGKSKESKMDKNGKIYFDFELKPNESKIIEFGYEIEKPTKN